MLKQVTDGFNLKVNKMKLIGKITGADILFDTEENLYFIEPDNSEGFYFDEQDLRCFSDKVANEVKNLLEESQC